MSATWALIILLNANMSPTGSTATIYFASKDLCDAAIVQLKASWHVSLAECVLIGPGVNRDFGLQPIKPTPQEPRR